MMHRPRSRSNASARGMAPRKSSTTSPFTVGRGEVVALMGRNGAEIDDHEGDHGAPGAAKRCRPHQRPRHFALKPFENARLGVGFTPEDRRIFTDLTVLENLDIGRQSPRTFEDGTQAPAWTPEILFRLFPNLAEMRHRLGGRISGGEQQMLTIARTLMGNPLIVLLDEPSEGIAPVIVEKIANTIVELKKRGLSILFPNRMSSSRRSCRTAPTCWRKVRFAGRDHGRIGPRR